MSPKTEVYAAFYITLMLSNLTANGDKLDFHNRWFPTKMFTVSSTADKGDHFCCLEWVFLVKEWVMRDIYMCFTARSWPPHGC